MAQKKRAQAALEAGFPTTISHSNFNVTSPPTNEYDVAAVVAMSEAATALAVALRAIADAANGRATAMNAPMISINGK